MNLFETATEKKKSVAAKATNDNITIKENDFHNAVYRLAEIDTIKEALNAEEKSLSDEVKSRSIEEFVKIYEATGTYPGSFDVVATGGTRINPTTKKAEKLKDAAFKCIPTDKYIMLNEESFDFLGETYGKEIVTKTTVYTMDTALVEKYGEAISKMIMACKEIPMEDKVKLISKTTTYSVTKGTIKNLKNFKASVSELVANILPVFQRKNIRIIA